MFKQKDFKLHTSMCMVGGFLAAYTLIRCSGNLAAAQTSNLIHAVEALLNLDFGNFLLCIGGFFSYVAGVESYVFVSHKTSWNPQKWALCMEALFLAFIGILPENISVYTCLYPAFYVMAAQWSAFHGTKEYNSSTIFSSNNVKQFSLALGEYLCEKQEKQAEKAGFFGMTLLCYHLGVAVAYVACQMLQQTAIWCCYLLLIPAFWNVYGLAERIVLPIRVVFRHRDA